MPKTPAQKARRKAKRAAKRAAVGRSNGLPTGRKPAQTQSKGGKRRLRKLERRLAATSGAGLGFGPRPRRQRRAGGAAAYTAMRFGGQMKTVTDGISIMKTIHNGSVIEDTFAVRREKVKNVIGSTGSSLTINAALFLNPGNTVLFPIFSQIAATYEQYRVNTLVFSYETEAYAASGTVVSAGKVLMATEYNSNNANFSSDGQMENYFNSDRGAPYCEIVHDVLLGDHALSDMPEKAYYVNSAANTIAPAGEAGKFFDLGVFQLATQGNADATSEIGELYVTYSFTMIRPKQQVPSGVNLLAAHVQESAATTGTAAAPLGTTGGVVKAGGNINVVATTTTFTIPVAGRFQLTGLWTNTAANIAAVPTFTLGANITAVALLADNTSGLLSGFSTTRGFITGYVDVSAAGTAAANTVTIGGLTGMTAATADIQISQVSSGLTLVRRIKEIKEEDQYLLEDRLGRLERMISTLISPPTPRAVAEEKHEFVDDTYVSESDKSDSSTRTIRRPRRLKVQQPPTPSLTGRKIGA